MVTEQSRFLVAEQQRIGERAVTVGRESGAQNTPATVMPRARKASSNPRHLMVVISENWVQPFG
jgi:hypothetical protein